MTFWIKTQYNRHGLKSPDKRQRWLSYSLYYRPLFHINICLLPPKPWPFENPDHPTIDPVSQGVQLTGWYCMCNLTLHYMKKSMHHLTLPFIEGFICHLTSYIKGFKCHLILSYTKDSMCHLTLSYLKEFKYHLTLCYMKLFIGHLTLSYIRLVHVSFDLGMGLKIVCLDKMTV